MSAIAVTSKNDKLVRFKDYLNHRATGNEPPVSIRAKDLDENFAYTTVVENPNETNEKNSYRVEYGPTGTYLTGISGLPEGAIAKQFAVCENGQAKQYWFVVWEQEPQI